MGLGHIGFAKDFLAVAVKQTVVLYPETLDRVLVVNADACSQLCPLFLLYFSCFSLEPELGYTISAEPNYSNWTGLPIPHEGIWPLRLHECTSAYSNREEERAVMNFTPVLP